MNRLFLASTIERLQVFLESEGALLLPNDVREHYLLRCSSLLQKAREPGEVLYVGILGGTGVGKSMLINALAREKISDSSDRRPFTDRAVVYRHRETPRGLEKVADLIREPDALHGIETIKDLVLLDLPDFDSIEEENRRTVLSILPELDSVVWVVSPEKYADAVFYDLVRSTHMHRDSFTFVLNKADELIAEGTLDTHSGLKKVLGDLAFRLKHEARVEHPRMFSLSAEYEFNRTNGHPVLEDEFRRFREFLMARRHAKEIASIKTVNLAEQTQQVLSELDSMIQPDEKIRILHQIRTREAESFTSRPVVRVGLLDAEKRLAVSLMRHLAAVDASIASVRWVQRILAPRRWSGITSDEDTVEAAFRDAADMMGEQGRADIESRAARSDSELLLAFEPSQESGDRAKADLVISRAIHDAARSFGQELENRKKALSGRLARFRRLAQKVVLLVPVVILLVKLAGHERIEAWVDSGSFKGFIKIITGLLTSLFSVEGLVGLSVLAICEVMLIYWLSVRRIRKTEREAESLSRSAINHLTRGLDRAVDQIRDERQRSLERVHGGLDRFKGLRSALLTDDSALSHDPAR